MDRAKVVAWVFANDVQIEQVKLDARRLQQISEMLEREACPEDLEQMLHVAVLVGERLVQRLELLQLAQLVEVVCEEDRGGVGAFAAGG